MEKMLWQLCIVNIPTLFCWIFTSLPPLYLAAVAGVYGALVELDHDDEADKKTKATGRTKASASALKARAMEEDATEIATETKPARKRI